MTFADGLGASSSVESRIEARIAELAAQIRSVLFDPEASPAEVERAMSILVPELQRLGEHVEAAGGPRFARICEACGRLDLRTRWRTMAEAEEAIALAEAWACRWCDASEFVVLEMRDAVRVGPRGPRSVAS